ncbi:MAG: hypothetical protein IPG34_10870 [Rhodocyclaceae bacterium]|jgi:hypothetical protein|nr:hypothetical protein [Rhodocyclaceae bacterium]
MNPLRTLGLITALLLAACGAPPDAASPPKADNRLAMAEAMFTERCKKAGVFIHRTAENVEGVFLLKVRPENEDPDFDDQFRLNDPYGRDLGGDGYIMTFLYGRDAQGSITERNIVKPGYRYVDAINPTDSKRYRYKGAIKEVEVKSSILIGGTGNTFKTTKFVLDKTPAPDPSPRYGVTYEDISTPEEREHWIAGSSLKVIDLQTNEVMAERIGYMMDHGQGNNSGGRSPWLLAANTACPTFGPRHGSGWQTFQARKLTEKVLKIASGE